VRVWVVCLFRFIGRGRSTSHLQKHADSYVDIFLFLGFECVRAVRIRVLYHEIGHTFAYVTTGIAHILIDLDRVLLWYPRPICSRSIYFRSGATPAGLIDFP
jgi:hypothetical protein